MAKSVAHGTSGKFWYVAAVVVIAAAALAGPTVANMVRDMQAKSAREEIAKRALSDSYYFINDHIATFCREFNPLPAGAGGTPAGTHFDASWERDGWTDYRNNDGDPNKPLIVEGTFKKLTEGDDVDLAIRWENGKCTIAAQSGSGLETK